MHTKPPATFDPAMNFDLADLGIFLEIYGMAKTSCHCIRTQPIPTVKDEATSADEELEGLLDMIVS